MYPSDQNAAAIQHLTEQLRSKDVNVVIDTIRKLGDLKDRRAVPDLILVLETTSDHTVRDTAAIALMDIGDERGLMPIVSLISSPQTEKHRGTLVYALSNFDISSILPFLVDLVITGNFEVSHQAFSLLEDTEIHTQKPVIDGCIQKCKQALITATTDREVLIRELIELLEEIA